ncbi:hypothetical protein G7054_g11775 [Neopestalotiopsis clavispora]|nr:hypothetical protein G7054_g11775 [Neopestalotiopsis clavispora]
MGPESSSEYFDVNGTIESTNTTRYLNVGSDSTSYKTLTLGETANTTAWGLEGDTIITTTGSTWGRHLPPDWERCAQRSELQQLSDHTPAVLVLKGKFMP